MVGAEDPCMKLNCYGGPPVSTIATTTTTGTGGCTCTEDYQQMPKDTTDCAAGYEHMTTVAECVKAAQFLQIQPSDTNSDGIQVDLRNTTDMTRWVTLRTFEPGNKLGFNKPFGCFADYSNRLDVVTMAQKTFTSIWVNGNTPSDGAGKHDNSAPLCKKKCPPCAGSIARKDMLGEKMIQETVQGTGKSTFMTAMSVVFFLFCTGFIARSPLARRAMSGLRQTTDPRDTDLEDLDSVEMARSARSQPFFRPSYEDENTYTVMSTGLLGPAE